MNERRRITAVLMIAAIVVAAGAWVWPKIRKMLAPLPDDGRRSCPHCGHAFEGTRRYCIACGGQIWDDVLGGRP